MDSEKWKVPLDRLRVDKQTFSHNVTDLRSRIRGVNGFKPPRTLQIKGNVWVRDNFKRTNGFL